MRKKTDLSRCSKNAIKMRRARAQETDEKRSERMAAHRRRYMKNKIKTEEPPISVHIENVRTLRPGADRRCSEKDWLKAVKGRMYSEKALLAAMTETKLELQGRLDCEKSVHCKPLLNFEIILNYEIPTASEKDPSNSEKDLYTSEQDSTSVEVGLNILCMREKTQAAQDLESIEITIKEEVLDTIKEEVLDTIKEEVLDTIKEEVFDD